MKNDLTRLEKQADYLRRIGRISLADALDRSIGDTRTLDAMQAFLSGAEWDAGTIEAVAEALVATGRDIAPPEEN